MTDPASPQAQRGRGSRARARAERPPRCERPKVENGRPCKRAAGGGTDHPGVGPCSLHDDGSWTRPAFADNVEARQAFLAAVTAQRKTRPGIRELIEPLGYDRRDVTALIDADPVFQDAYVEARGYDPDRIRTELADRAFDRKDPASARLLELEAKMHLPEGRALLSRMRVDGKIELSAAPVIDVSKLTLEEQRTLRALLQKARPEPEHLMEDQRPALELLPGGESIA